MNEESVVLEKEDIQNAIIGYFIAIIVGILIGLISGWIIWR